MQENRSKGVNSRRPTRVGPTRVRVLLANLLALTRVGLSRELALRELAYACLLAFDFTMSRGLGLASYISFGLERETPAEKAGFSGKIILFDVDAGDSLVRVKTPPRYVPPRKPRRPVQCMCVTFHLFTVY